MAAVAVAGASGVVAVVAATNPVPDHPVLKPHFRVTIVPGDGVFFVADTDVAVLAGRHFELLVPLLDGRRSPDELVAALAGELAPAEVFFALEELAAGGFLASPSRLPARAAAFWEEAGLSAASVERACTGLAVAVSTVGDLDPEPFRLAVARSGVVVAGDSGLSLVFADHYLRPELAAINADHHERGKAWLLVRPLGTELWIGPIFMPGRTGCWECLAERLRGNLQVDDYLQRRLGSVPPPAAGAVPASLDIAAGLAVFELTRWRADGADSLAGQVLSFNLATRATALHRLVRRPQCRACGGATLPPTTPVLHSVDAVVCGDGGQRVEAPEETYRRLQHHISPITGIVKSIDPSGLPPGPAHVFSAGHNLAFRSRKLSVLQKHMRSRSGGKGMTTAQARTAALCEALERYSSQFQGTEYTVRKCLCDLEGEAIHPNDCMLFSPRQYDRREETNRSAGEFHLVPEPFAPDAEVDWVPVWSLTQERFRYLPAAYVYFHTPALPHSPAVGSCFPDSNGNASGSALEEAILQGLLEVVERDAVALWWYNRLRRPEVPLEALDEPFFLEVRKYYRALGRDLWLLDLTADSGIPVIGAVSRAVGAGKDHILFGFGAHLDLRLAAERAVTEMTQFLPKALAADEGRSREHLDADTRRWFDTAMVDDQPYVLPEGMSQTLGAPALSTDLLENLTACRHRLESLGLEVLVADMTRPDVGLHVAKTIVPGMRHFWRRLAPGRLYEVPVTMGWLPAPLDEDVMNPFSMFV